MRMLGWALVLLLLVGSAEAQRALKQVIALRELSGQWARYYAEMYGVPLELVEAVIEEESAWNPYAVSNRGAAGLMQLMPETAVRFGVRNRFRIDGNLQGGVAYLAWLNRRFHGDLRLVMAAYCVGESRIETRGLAFANPDAYSYVSRIARRYRDKRTRLTMEPAQKQRSQIAGETQ
jgi:soluble lytic murein transglycosylase-like protein